jgi:hypothetical protein
VLHSDLKASNVLLKLTMSAASSSGIRTSFSDSSSSSSHHDGDGSSSRGCDSPGGDEGVDAKSRCSTRSRPNRLSLIQHGQLVGKVCAASVYLLNII